MLASERSGVSGAGGRGCPNTAPRDTEGQLLRSEKRSSLCCSWSIGAVPILHPDLLSYDSSERSQPIFSRIFLGQRGFLCQQSRVPTPCLLSRDQSWTVTNVQSLEASLLCPAQLLCHCCPWARGPLRSTWGLLTALSFAAYPFNPAWTLEPSAEICNGTTLRRV